ncbi:MAG: polysaccharide deacetylase family protein [Clostridia bacterium]|nr:polysaccharide deacetylase family protein [Clostridia bacterium]
MKKWFVFALVLCMLTVLGAALADSAPTVAFDKKSGAMNGGFDYTLTVKAHKAPESDLTVTVQAEKLSKSWDVVIPAGETKASLTIPLDLVEETVKYDLTFAPSENYTAKKVTKHTVTVRPLPKVQFYLAVNYGRVGKSMSVKVMCSNPTAIVKSNNTFELRDSDGTVLDTRSWSSPKQKLTFKFDVTENMTGRRYFTVWLGDYNLTPNDGYGSISAGERTVYSTEPLIPLMGIGIDCAYAADRTDEILAILEKHNVKCTFFMTSFFLTNFTEEAQKIRDAGHEIANHSQSHEHMKTLRSGELFRQITTPIEHAETLLGVTPRLFRPPYGEYNGNVTSLARSEGMEVIMWSATAHDSSFKYTQEQVLRFATTGSDFKPGSILLMHLNGMGSNLTLETALPYYESLGLKVVPISALLYASGKELPERNGKEPLVYTNEYWENWLVNNLPEYAAQLEALRQEQTQE